MMPAGAMIFQLPHLPFPSDRPHEKTDSNEHARAYIMSKSLRWSWGTIDGRHQDWAESRVRLAPAHLASMLVSAGFAGIWVDRLGYDSGQKPPSTELGRILQVNPLVSSDGRYEFFDMRPYAASVREGAR
jgi:phosphoglycerol transferase